MRKRIDKWIEKVYFFLCLCVYSCAYSFFSQTALFITYATRSQIHM